MILIVWVVFGRVSVLFPENVTLACVSFLDSDLLFLSGLGRLVATITVFLVVAVVVTLLYL